MKAKISGFTLIELMIVVVIVGILAMIALPAYQDSVRKSRRADVLTKLLDTQLQQEKWRANNIRYAMTAASVGSPSSNYYNFAIVSATNSYTVVAIPLATQTNDKQYGTDCGKGLFIDQTRKGHYTAAPNTSSVSAAETNKNPASQASECWRK